MKVLPCLCLLLAAALAVHADDADIPSPVPVDVVPARGDGDGPYVLLTFRAVTGLDDLAGYRIWRQVAVLYDADASGQLVALDEPVLAWVPWGRVDAVPGEATVRVLVALLDDDEALLGVSAETASGAVSPIAVFPPTPRTAVVARSWGALKARSR